ISLSSKAFVFAQFICLRERLFIYFLIFQSLRSLLGEELTEFLESEERERRLDAVRTRIRLLRDLRVDTRARGVWARLLNDQPQNRKHKSGSKKAGSSSRSGCFGHKMDRIGTISGMGC
uniref:Natriuretic peptide C n=1 Tax=Astatotilapia calliptera TaxID=8154 RepID=A0A3P8R9B5_ASTCA